MLHEAILEIHKNAVNIVGDTLETVFCEDKNGKRISIDNDLVSAKITELQADYDSRQYQRDRAVAYPSTADQLDLLYHQGIEGWKTEIKKVKDAHPKPEST